MPIVASTPRYLMDSIATHIAAGQVMNGALLDMVDHFVSDPRPGGVLCP